MFFSVCSSNLIHLFADGNPTMVTGSAAGHMAFWDLETRSLRSQTLEAHGKAVSGLRCLPTEPIMVTSSGDNTLKVRGLFLVGMRVTSLGDNSLKVRGLLGGWGAQAAFWPLPGLGLEILCFKKKKKKKIKPANSDFYFAGSRKFDRK